VGRRGITPENHPQELAEKELVEQVANLLLD